MTPAPAPDELPAAFRQLVSALTAQLKAAPDDRREEMLDHLAAELTPPPIAVAMFPDVREVRGGAVGERFGAPGRELGTFHVAELAERITTALEAAASAPDELTTIERLTRIDARLGRAYERRAGPTN